MNPVESHWPPFSVSQNGVQGQAHIIPHQTQKNITLWIHVVLHGGGNLLKQERPSPELLKYHYMLSRSKMSVLQPLGYSRPQRRPLCADSTCRFFFLLLMVIPAWLCRKRGRGRTYFEAVQHVAFFLTRGGEHVEHRAVRDLSGKLHLG